MGSKSIKNTLNRNGTFYLQFRDSNQKLFKKSLKTDSAKQAAIFMAQLSAYIPLVQTGSMPVEDFRLRVDQVLSGNSEVETAQAVSIKNNSHKPITRAELDGVLHKFLTGDYLEAQRIPNTAPLARKIAGEPISGAGQAATAGKVNELYVNEYINGSEGTKRLIESVLNIQGKSGEQMPFEMDSAAVEVDMHRAMLHRAYQQFYSGDINGYRQTLEALKPTVKPGLFGDVSNGVGVTLADAWNNYKRDKGKGWTGPISAANERFMEVIFAVLGQERDVALITRQDIQQVMGVVSGLPKRVVQPYRSMTIQQMIALEDIPDEQLLGIEAVHKHLKIYKSLFKTYLIDSKNILEKSPTDGISAPPPNARFGAYTPSEMRKFVSYAINDEKRDWMKWIILLLAYTGARRAEIARLTKSQIRFDEDSKRHYLLIAEGGQGKTDNATRQVTLHQHLIDLGFLDYVNSQWKEQIFSEVAGKNMTMIGKLVSDIRDQLGISHTDDHGQRRLLHSFRHSVVTTALGGWVTNIAHLQ